MERQRSLFGEQSLNPVLNLKRELARALKESGLTRELFVDRLNPLISLESLRTRGKDGLVTLAMLDKWLGPEAPDLPAVKLLPAIFKALGSAEPAQALVAPVGCRVIGPGEILLLEYGRAQMAKRQAGRRERRLAEQIEENSR